MEALPVMPLKIAIPPPAAIPKAMMGANNPNIMLAGSISVGPVLYNVTAISQVMMFKQSLQIPTLQNAVNQA